MAGIGNGTRQGKIKLVKQLFSMQYFYDPSLVPDSKDCTLGREESNHVIRVLRKKVGDPIQLTNGQGHVFTARIVDPSLKACRAEIVKVEKVIPKMYSLHLAVAPTKSMDRYEWFLEKATEIGVDEITPILCEHSERKVLKRHRLDKVLQSAMKQSKRAYLPKLNDLTKLSDFLEVKHESLQFIAHCQEGEKSELKRRIFPDKDIVIMIGPEGDFSEKEIQLALEKGYSPVSMGEYRLRTETAAILACATFAFINTR